MKAFVTGCAGFIGSNLVDRLLSDGYSVIGIDNLSSGSIKFLEQANKNKNFKFIETDILKTRLVKYMQGCDIVFHFSANADIRFGLNDPLKDYKLFKILLKKILHANKKEKIYFILINIDQRKKLLFKNYHFLQNRQFKSKIRNAGFYIYTNKS